MNIPFQFTESRSPPQTFHLIESGTFPAKMFLLLRLKHFKAFIRHSTRHAPQLGFHNVVTFIRLDVVNRESIFACV